MVKANWRRGHPGRGPASAGRVSAGRPRTPIHDRVRGHHGARTPGRHGRRALGRRVAGLLGRRALGRGRWGVFDPLPSGVRGRSGRPVRSWFRRWPCRVRPPMGIGRRCGPRWWLASAWRGVFRWSPRLEACRLVSSPPRSRQLSSFEPTGHDTRDVAAVGDENVSAAFRARKPRWAGQTSGRKPTARLPVAPERRAVSSQCWLN